MKRNGRVREYLSEGRENKAEKETPKMSRPKGEKEVRQTDRKKRKKESVTQ